MGKIACRSAPTAACRAFGLSAFNPEQIRDNPTPPTVVVTNFSIFNQAAEVDLSMALPYWESGWFRDGLALLLKHKLDVITLQPRRI